MYQALTLSAGVAVEFLEDADFFRVLSAPTTDLTLIFYKQGKEVGQARNVGAGYAEKTSIPFDKVRISSTAGGAVAFVSRIGNEVRYDAPPQGNVQVTSLVPTRSAGTNTQATVTNTSAQLVAANASRSYLLIQNKDATGNIYVTFGAAATVANGLLIPPGGSYELNCNILTAQVNAIGDIASNANVVVVTG